MIPSIHRDGVAYIGRGSSRMAEGGSWPHGGIPCPPRQMSIRFQPGSEPRTFGQMARRCMCGSAARDRRPFCSMVMVRPATCGRPSQRSLRATTRLSPPTYAGWASPPAPTVGTTRRHRARMSPACSTCSGSRGRTSSPTTSAIWWDTPSRRSIRAGSPASSSWTRRCRASGHGTRCSSNPLLWHFRFRRP